MVVQDNQFKLVRAIKVHVQFGPIGPAGVTVLLIVTAVSKLEPVIVSMVQKGTVQDRQMMNNNAIDNPVVNNGQCFIGIICFLAPHGISF